MNSATRSDHPGRSALAMLDFLRIFYALEMGL